MYRIYNIQIYTSINTTSWIPTAGWCLMIYLYRNYILTIKFHQISDIKWEWSISIRMASHLCSIDPNCSIHIYATKINSHTFILRCFSKRETLSVPANSTRKISAFCFHLRWILLFNTVVMRQIYMFPFRIIKCRFFRTWSISQIELPVVIKIDISFCCRIIVYINNFFIRTHLAFCFRKHIDRSSCRKWNTWSKHSKGKCQCSCCHTFSF